jgi:large subunit ribosomal protein L25
VLNVVSHTLPLYCSADLIPDEILVDLTGLQIGQSVHLSDIKLPDRVTSVSRTDVTLCTISAQAKEEEVVVVEAEVSAEVPATAQKLPAGDAAAPAAGGKDAKDAKGATPAKGAAPAKEAAPAKGAAPPAAAAPKKK